MGRNHRYHWPEDTRIDRDRIDHCFELLLGRGPTDDREGQALLDIARRRGDPRLEVVRALLQKPDFLDRNRDIVPLFVDLMMRARVFWRHAPPRANLFCVGAANAGTTTLAAALGAHQDIHLPSVRETNYFSHFAPTLAGKNGDHSLYDYYFFGWSGERYLSDFSPNYLRNHAALAAIRDYNPTAKMLVCLRNPVERALSAYAHTSAHHKAESVYAFFSDATDDFRLEDTPGEAWHSARNLLRQGLYFADVDFLTQNFRDVMMVEYGELPRMDIVYHKLCRFLDIEPVNAASLAGVAGRAKAVLPHEEDELRRTRALLTDFYAADMAAMARTYHVDLETEPAAEF